jgi:plastocyanin
MKKIITPVLFLICVIVAMSAKATTHTVTVGDFAFSPAQMTVNLGDTILFQWVTGSHTTTSTNIPSGAASWDNPMTSAAPTFTYIPAVIGTYNYKCTPHESMGMVGTFDVVKPTSVPAVTASVQQLTVSPNPASNRVQVSTSLKNPSIQLLDVSGKLVRQMPVMNNNGQIMLDVSTVPAGVYILKAAAEDRTEISRITVLH